MQTRKINFRRALLHQTEKAAKNGDAPVFMHITIAGRYLEASLKRGVNPKLWTEKGSHKSEDDSLNFDWEKYVMAS